MHSIRSLRCKVLWPLDDICISHVSKDVVLSVADYLSSRYRRTTDYNQRESAPIPWYGHFTTHGFQSSDKIDG